LIEKRNDLLTKVFIAETNFLGVLFYN